MQTEAEIAAIHMQRIVGELERLERRKHEYAIEYWGWQAYSRPVDECHHEASHFCTACGNNA